MATILRFLILLLLCLPALSEGLLANDCKQLLVVVAPTWDSPQGRLTRWQKDGDSWSPAGPSIPVVLGRSGLGWGLGEHPLPQPGPQKQEGDDRAPAGLFAIAQLWLRTGITPPPPQGFPPQFIHADTIGVDDVNSHSYNRILRVSEISGPSDWNSWEKMDIPDYDRVLVVAHNLDRPKPGRGSCIFIHRWENDQVPTSGCTAMDEQDMARLIEWLRPALHPRLVQLPQSVAREWQQKGWIPSSSSR